MQLLFVMCPSGGGWNLECRSVRRRAPLGGGKGDTREGGWSHEGQEWGTWKRRRVHFQKCSQAVYIHGSHSHSSPVPRLLSYLTVAAGFLLQHWQPQVTDNVVATLVATVTSCNYQFLHGTRPGSEPPAAGKGYTRVPAALVADTRTWGKRWECCSWSWGWSSAPSSLWTPLQQLGWTLPDVAAEGNRENLVYQAYL